MGETTITLPRDLSNGLLAASERMNRPVDALVRDAIERYLARSESVQQLGGWAPETVAHEPETDDAIEIERRSS